MKKFLLVILFTLVSVSSFATEPLKNYWQYIEHLNKNKSYYHVIEELNRLKIENPKQKKEYNYLISCYYFKGEQYKSTIKFTIQDKQSFRNDLLKARSYKKLRLYQQSENILQNYTYNLKKSNLNLYLLKTNLELYLTLRNYELALAEINKYKEANKDLQAQTMYLEILNFQKSQKKIPWLSSSFSAIIPGLGQLYSQNYSGAIISLLAVAASATATWFSFHKGQKQLGIFCGVATALCYSGSIYGAYNSANRFNYQKTQKFNNSFSNKYNLNYDPLLLQKKIK